MGAHVAQVSPPPRAGDEQRRRILRAATECLAIWGADGVKLRDIAERAGVSVGMLQHYFVARDPLLIEAFDWSSRELCSYWDRLVAGEDDPWDRITSLISDFTGHPQLRDHCKTWVELCAAGGRRPELRPAVERIVTWWREALDSALRQGEESGQFRLLLPRPTTVDLLVAAVDGWELRLASEASPLTAAQMREAFLSSARVLLGLGLEPD